MNDETQKPHDRAIDALIVAALRPELLWDESREELFAAEANLTEDDRYALSALGLDLVERIVSGAWTPHAPTCLEHVPSDALDESLLATALNRGTQDAPLPEEVREEMEQRIRESEENGETMEESRP